MKQRISKFSIGMLVLVTVLLGSFSLCPAVDTAEKIVTKQDSYNGKKVSVKGTVSNLKFNTVNMKDNYTTFVLVGDEGGRINVFSWGALKLQPGQKVRVRGRYYKVRRIANRNFYNEIEASKVKSIK